MNIGGADSMRGAIMAHFKASGHGFELIGEKTSAETVSGHHINMFRSRQLALGVLGGQLDLVLMGSDIDYEVKAHYKAYGQKPREFKVLETFSGYGREFLNPTLDWAVHQSRADEGITAVGPSLVIATEHPYTVREKVSVLFRPVNMGEEGSPLDPQDFRLWMKEENERISRDQTSTDKRLVVGICIVDGKIPSILERGMADIGTIVTESGRTNRANNLITEHIKGIRMRLISLKSYAEGNEEAEMFAKGLRDSHKLSRKEYITAIREREVADSVIEEFTNVTILNESPAEPMGRRL